MQQAARSGVRLAERTVDGGPGDIGLFVIKSVRWASDIGKYGNNCLYFPANFAIVYENQFL